MQMMWPGGSHADDAVKVVEAAAKEAPIVIGERMTRFGPTLIRSVARNNR